MTRDYSPVIADEHCFRQSHGAKLSEQFAPLQVAAKLPVGNFLRGERFTQQGSYVATLDVS